MSQPFSLANTQVAGPPLQTPPPQTQTTLFTVNTNISIEATRFVAKGRPRSVMLQATARREAALQRQAAAREQRTSALREMLEAHARETEAEAVHIAEPTAPHDVFVMQDTTIAAPATTATLHRAEPRWHRTMRFDFASRLMQPSMMQHVPEDAVERWIMTSRPEGLRALVICRGGVTTSRKKNGSFLHRFESIIPGGGPSLVTAGAALATTVLDCVYSAQLHAYFVLDVLSWNSVDALGESECRLFFLEQKFRELGACVSATHTVAGPQGEQLVRNLLTLPTPTVASNTNTSSVPMTQPAPMFHLMPWIPVSSAGFISLYPHDPLFVAANGVKQDGYLFLHRSTVYEFGPSELLLQWKDGQSSPWLIDSAPPPTPTSKGTDTTTAAAEQPQSPVPSNKQLITLRLGQSRQLECIEGDVLDELDEYTYQTNSFRPGALLQFEIDGVEEMEDVSSSHGQAQQTDESKQSPPPSSSTPHRRLLGLHFLKRASPARVLPDSRDRILYQYHARTGQLLDAIKIVQDLKEQEAGRQQQPETGNMTQHATSGTPSTHGANSSSNAMED